MIFYTPVAKEKDPLMFSYADTIMLLGSCFTENIGKRLVDNKFQTDINPFGILYNPASVAQAIRRLIRPGRFREEDLFLYEGAYHSYAHHSRFSMPSQTETLEAINRRLEESAEKLQHTTRLVVTFGTAYVYRLKNNGAIVANCHKQPATLFDREQLTVDEIFADWHDLLLSLWEHNPKVKLLFTVSPIRHWKDGAHGNQLSKATLLLAIDRLQKTFPGQIDYFPAYEIMMDELRDYRYYADDMLHPSSLAIEYIGQRFEENRFTDETKQILSEWRKIRKAIEHRPFQQDSDAHQQFIHQTLLKMEEFQKKFPSFDLRKERSQWIIDNG
ncbi:hypothetical protein M2137_001110 [Parabacteroides sp. PFB2-10]|uniref:GSCFA domain-containing protein n=1 Tax=Parabacteroides sp. PFB2-10 TaxID=1742405 RepID=UPI002476BB93|nr:GSCFA domain-containing protein [Parabacteroides sp. PFB2-10]MDH6312340.1 hypothetical protein [Parabacteroides sp. PFB2-10]MDL2245390.1 GSCFA domain-containing protein [Parabacteroides sp. OttesenSCG-928-J18]